MESARARLRSVLLTARRRFSATATDTGTAAASDAPANRAPSLYPIGPNRDTPAPHRPGPRELHVSGRRARGRHIVAVSGTLDLRTRGALAQALEEALEGEGEEIVLDLGELDSSDHAGLDTVLTAHLRASDELKLLVIIPGPERVQRVFDHAQAPFLYASGRAGRDAGRSPRLRPGLRTGAASSAGRSRTPGARAGAPGLSPGGRSARRSS